ncbi:Chromosome initiation inhibitor [hydrothermal vent metagenome]|uniref:Chromosome initiation inhibitor n=1 Tax=hydrothermal vent metagenome TaxID=652676 RepID=A0A1W1CHH3_9ZZZZ
MLKDFVKLETFLTVVRERSFSRASAKLGISQPAVTQQIKFIENYLTCKVIERKKNGIKLTNEGEELYKVAAKLEKEILSSEHDILKIMNKEITFKLGASYTIGTYIIPGKCLNSMGEVINNDINLDIDVSDRVVEKLKDRKLDVGIIESPVIDHDLVYREWLEDELVIVSNVPLSKVLKTEELYEFDWICRDEASHTRRVIADVFEELGISCKSFNLLSEVSNTTSVLQMLKKIERNPERPVVSILSKYAVIDEVANGELFESRLRGYTMKRKFFIVYSKENKHNAYVENVVNYILAGNC